MPTPRHARAAIAALFFVHGSLFATWVSRIPAIKEARHLSPSSLGLALLAIGLGTVLGLPVTSWSIGRWGSHRVLGAAALGACLALPLAVLAPAYAVLIAGLFVFGASLGAMDVAMNAQASLLERTAGRSMMSSFHGLWSLGGIVASLTGSALTARGFGTAGHFFAAGAVLALLTVLVIPQLVDDRHSHGGSPPALAWPPRAALAIGAMAASGAIVEGGIADWSGVYLREALHASAAVAPLGFAAFSLAMTVARFTGDRLIDRFGRRTLLRVGPALTAAALAVALLTAQPAVAIVALGFAGLGMATVFPIAFGEAGALPGLPGHAIAAVATMAYGAQMLGPPVIGFVAEGTSLQTALGLMIAGCLVIVVLAGRMSMRAHRAGD